MSTSALESEDLENVPLVRMEDVQPSRTYELISRRRSDEEVLETCVIEDIEYDNECIVNDDDDDSNIGSMVSIKSEEIFEEDSEAEMIVPERLESSEEAVVEVKVEKKFPSSWPTLEILPGGVIKKPEKTEESQNDCPGAFDDSTGKAEAGEMIYACAKCSQRFKFLFCLVKHVKWHEDEAKKLNGTEVKPKHVHLNKKKMIICMKTHKKKSPKKMKS